MIECTCKYKKNIHQSMYRNDINCIINDGGDGDGVEVE